MVSDLQGLRRAAACLAASVLESLVFVFGAFANTVARGMSRRLLPLVLNATCALALASAASAQASPALEQAASPAAAAPVPAAAAASSSDANASAVPSTRLAGFEALASVGYGAITEVKALEINPYGATLGVDLGYTWDVGVRAGAKLIYGLGRAVPQTYELRRGEIELTAESDSLNVVASISYDLRLHWLILRYSLGLGVTWVSWDLGELEGYTAIEGYTAPSGSSVGFLFAPGLAVLWPYGIFEWGLGFDYLFQAEFHNPSGIVGQLLVGMKL